jgi:hypothetical protein
VGVPPVFLLIASAPAPFDPGANPVAIKYADLISANAAALAAQKDAHEALASATDAKATADADAAASNLALATAIRQAGGFLVDPSSNPPMLYTSDDGQGYSARPIPSAGDAVPGMDPAPTPVPAPG